MSVREESWIEDEACEEYDDEDEFDADEDEFEDEGIEAEFDELDNAFLASSLVVNTSLLAISITILNGIISTSDPRAFEACCLR